MSGHPPSRTNPLQPGTLAAMTDLLPVRPPQSPGLSRLALPARLLLAATGLLLALAGPAAAQNVVVDQGTFLLSREGVAIGTEDFTIRRSGSGPDVKYIATAEASIEVSGQERRISAALEARSPQMRITAYQVKEGGDRRSEIYMTLSGSRFQATHRSPEGEQLREYRATPSSVVLEQNLAHHYFFLAARVTEGSVTVPGIVPRTGARLRLQVRDTGLEQASIVGQAVQARHLVVSDGDETVDVWMDEEGRVLRVVNRTTGFRAERRNPPG